MPETPEQTQEEINIKLFKYAEHLHEEDCKGIATLEFKIWQYQEYQKHLLGMLTWIKENFGDVDTSNFGNTNLAEYIDECLEMEKELSESLK